MISHITLGVRRIDRATEFYDDVLGALGYQRSHSGNGFAGYGVGTEGVFWICLPYDGNSASVGNGTHVAFLAPSCQAVDGFFIG